MGIFGGVFAGGGWADLIFGAASRKRELSAAAFACGRARSLCGGAKSTGPGRCAFAALRAGGTAGRDARDQLVRHNLRLVAHVTKKYYAATSNQDDLISIGTIGLIKAVDTFDPARASKFASYASRCIENELRMELRRIRREGITVSLQEPLEAGGGQLTLADTLPDDTVMEDDCERRADAARLRRLVETLPVREQTLLRLRYGLDGERPATQQQTAERLGISRSYV